MRVQRRSLQLGLAFKIQLEVATSPAQHFENCGIVLSIRRTYGMGDLALRRSKTSQRVVCRSVKDQLAALAAHFQ